jgi:hypothetical protein
VPARKSTTTAKGLGWRHQQQVKQLIGKLIDGTLCWWCGLPMHRDKTRNWDSKQLAGDHSQARVVGGTIADRLLHGTCNSQRQDGRLDHLRPVILGCHPKQWAAALKAQGVGITLTDTTTSLAMDWD